MMHSTYILKLERRRTKIVLHTSHKQHNWNVTGECYRQYVFWRRRGYFKTCYGTVDMTFCARQLQPVYHVSFLNLNKAFDIVFGRLCGKSLRGLAVHNIVTLCFEILTNYGQSLSSNKPLWNIPHYSGTHTRWILASTCFLVYLAPILIDVKIPHAWRPLQSQTFLNKVKNGNH